MKRRSWNGTNKRYEGHKHPDLCQNQQPIPPANDGYDGGESIDEALNSNKCFELCTDDSRTDGKIKADGFWPGKDGAGSLIDPSAWCQEQLANY